MDPGTSCSVVNDIFSDPCGPDKLLIWIALRVMTLIKEELYAIYNSECPFRLRTGCIPFKL